MYLKPERNGKEMVMPYIKEMSRNSLAKSVKITG
jgi:hypothetical protein